MTPPQSARAWLCWAVAVREFHHSPRPPALERRGHGDRRVNDRYETALSVLALLERSAAAAGDDIEPEAASLVLGVATGLLSWAALSGKERSAVIRVSCRFARALQDEGFLPREERSGEANPG